MGSAAGGRRVGGLAREAVGGLAGCFFFPSGLGIRDQLSELPTELRSLSII